MDLEKYIENNTMQIIVKPNSSKNEITGYDPAKQAIRVNIKAPPENNKANIEVIKLFSKETKHEVKIIKGLASKRKVLKFI